MYIYKVYCQSLYYLAWLATTRMEFKEVVEVISSQSVSSEIFKSYFTFSFRTIVTNQLLRILTISAHYYKQYLKQ